MAQVTKSQCFFDVGGPPIKVDTHIVTFLCPHCPNIHMEINIIGVGVMRYIWHSDDAEILAAMLLNPQPMPPDEMHMFKKE